MSGIYSFSDGGESLDSNAVLVEENIVWDQDIRSGDQVVIGYTSASDEILTDTISESFVSADDDGSTTQYFSVLETSSDTILGDMNVTINEEGVVEETVECEDLEEAEEVNNFANDIMLYNVPGEGLYGIQSAEDEEGNLQKYRFKLRQNEDGQLEAITDSIQILSVENEEEATELQELPSEVPEPVDDTLLPKPTKPAPLFVKQEYGLHSEENLFTDETEVDSTDGLQINDEDTGLSFEEDTETKPILEKKYVPLDKEKMMEETPPEEIFTDLHEVESDNVEVETVNVKFLNEHSEISAETDNHFENVFVEENHMDNHFEEGEVVSLHFEENTMQSNHTNDSDPEDYNVVEGLHVTADTEPLEIVYESPVKYISPLKQTVAKQYSTTKLLKSAVRNNFIKGICETNGISKPSLLAVRQNEKENVSNIQFLYNYQKPNPRSILKSSFSLLEENNMDVNPVRNVDRRVLKNKTTSQARLLQNSIAKTTIIHAPVRQERLPRKQTIKPVQRQDEEIIVQEVVVSSNGFIETSEDGILKCKEPLQPTVFLNVSDSDDDYDPKNRSKRKRRHKRDKTKTITISDSDDERHSEASVIELSDTTDTETSEKNSSDKLEKGNELKKRRGRPSKTNKPTEEQSVVETDKQEIKCNKCSKTFPSQGSLKTHMQYHNFRESSLRNTRTTANKFICTHCKATFKTSILLNKHLTDHKNLGCTICKKIFKTAMELSTHRKTHIKGQMVRSSIPQKHSPKQSQIPRKSAFKSPPKFLKCDVCSRTFKDATKLEGHLKIHKKITCLNCGASFVSKIVFDLHVRENCVKIKSPIRKRLSVVKNSPRKLRESDKRIFGNIKCDLCEASFGNHTSLFKHKVTEHGLDTPDKNVLKKTTRKLYEPKTVFGGIRPRNVLRDAYMLIRRKVAES